MVWQPVRGPFSLLDLRETLLDLTQKPIVVLNRTLDGFERQCFRSNPTAFGGGGGGGIRTQHSGGLPAL